MELINSLTAARSVAPASDGHRTAEVRGDACQEMPTNRVPLAGRSIAWRAAQTSLDFAALFERWDRRLLRASVGSRPRPHEHGQSGT